jgi:hypothetical protein
VPLILFLVIFPLVVLRVFYQLVTKHYEKLYAPRDFPDIHGFHRARQAAIMLRVDDRRDKYGELWRAIDTNKPILEARGGKFMEHDLEEYLDLWEGLYDWYVEEVIPKKMFYNAYSHQIEKTYDNPEVRQFVQESQKESPEFYTGLERLARAMKEMTP